MQFGGLHHQAPELRVPRWIDGQGHERAPLTLSDLGGGLKVLFCFQHACPGCHSRGFPTLRYLHAHLAGRGVGFAVIQTAFEDLKVNGFDKLRLNQTRYELPVPFGQDTKPAGEQYPTFMGDYRSAGTPWFTLVDPGGKVIYADFRIDAPRFVAAFGLESVEFD